ncbi:hypothetical protein EXIGLDRAFT_830354 [Exidia glandulosa HHB12029]|uniref:MYND-type domain-containing protein n=1 Tax=Exidia glandulosa HHB12029 TaxID=1314781 RepID=A0A165NLF5_EXIGL|nr:hypothetical protein EXIGLDRAFT_830354 [Exidia glandulosa HHB12029]
MSTSSETTKCCAICAYPATSRCSGCGKVFYCSQEHQKTAWQKHKRLCKIYQRQAKGEEVAADSFCGLCGKTDGPLKKTACCKKTVCDDYGNYRPFSYGNDSCARNHDRYTRCCYHYNERHPGSDSVSCDQCSNSHDAEIEAWYMTNNFNFQDDIERATPPSFQPAQCSKCQRPMKLNCEAHSYGRDGHECQRCMAGLMGSTPASNIFAMDGIPVQMPGRR